VEEKGEGTHDFIKGKFQLLSVEWGHIAKGRRECERWSMRST
jgi:hypothetical protein